ncbi:hypothetical protein [Abyssisolibacter fermentans]|nr:hypothetical protein [Abyssisolibacter fermentans]
MIILLVVIVIVVGVLRLARVEASKIFSLKLFGKKHYKTSA